LLSEQQLLQLQQWSVEYAPLLKGLVSAPLIAGFTAIAIGSYPPLRVSAVHNFLHLQGTTEQGVRTPSGSRQDAHNIRFHS
jgi:hypothetical protein